MPDTPYLTREQHDFIMAHWLPRLIIERPDVTVQDLYAMAAKRLRDLDVALSPGAPNEPGTNQRLVVRLGDAENSTLLLTSTGVIRRT